MAAELLGANVRFGVMVCTGAANVSRTVLIDTSVNAARKARS